MKVNYNFAATAVAMILAGHAIAADVNAGVVVSKNGFCHDSHSPQFNQVVPKEQTSFSDLATCVAAGYQLPAFYQQNYPELYLASLTSRKAALEQSIATKTEPPEPSAEALVAKGKELAKLDKEIAKAEQDAQDNMNFQGFNWNPALATLFYKDKAISDISISAAGADGKGRVQIGKEFDTQTALMIEVHYFLRSDTLKNTLGGSMWGWGPFIATSAGGTEKASLGSVFGAGFMAGMKTEGRNSMNIGLGWFTDQDVTILRDDLVDGSPTSVTDSAALTRKTNGEGWFLIFSASF